MTDSRSELIVIAEDLEQLVTGDFEPKVWEATVHLKNAAEKIGKSWSRSWLGYHSYVYYEYFEEPPTRARFSSEWGMDVGILGSGTIGDWIEYNPDEVMALIREEADNPDMNPARNFIRRATTEFLKQKDNLLSISDIESNNSESNFLIEKRQQIADTKLIRENEFLVQWRPKQLPSSRDNVAKNQGLRNPPHLRILAEVYSIQNTARVIMELAKISRQIDSHIVRQRQRSQPTTLFGNRVFIGHGRSSIWRELKDFLEDQLGLLVDEFNRIPIAGIATTNRLSSMLDSAGIAFLIMTGEDEQADGQVRARENVVHEAGLFQGRLGFERAIIILEEGCEEFSNIAGLGQIRFPKGKIRAAFQDVREVLEREEIIKGGPTL